MRLKPATFRALALGILGALLLSAAAGAAEIRVMISGGLTPAYKVLVPEFEIAEPAFGYLREGYEKFVRHIDRPMKMIGRLVQRGIPAEVVMKLIAKEDALR